MLYALVRRLGAKNRNTNEYKRTQYREGKGKSGTRATMSNLWIIFELIGMTSLNQQQNGYSWDTPSSLAFTFNRCRPDLAWQVSHYVSLCFLRSHFTWWDPTTQSKRVIRVMIGGNCLRKLLELIRVLCLQVKTFKTVHTQDEAQGCSCGDLGHCSSCLVGQERTSSTYSYQMQMVFEMSVFETFWK